MLLDDFKPVFFDDRVCQNLFGDAFELLLRFVAVPSVEIQNEELSLSNIGNLRIAQSRKGVLNGLSLWIEDSTLRHYPDVCFHTASIALPGAPQAGRRFRLSRSVGDRKENSKLFATSWRSSASVRPID